MEGCSCLARLFPEEHSFLLLFPATDAFLALVHCWLCPCRACPWQGKVCSKPPKLSHGNPCGSRNAIPSVFQPNPSAASTGIPQNRQHSIALVQTRQHLHLQLFPGFPGRDPWLLQGLDSSCSITKQGFSAASTISGGFKLRLSKSGERGLYFYNLTFTCLRLREDQGDFYSNPKSSIF